MSDVTIVQAFSEAAARLTRANDMAGSLVALLGDCTSLLAVDEGGLLVEVPSEGLQLISSTSHLTADLELYELQSGVGPCVEAAAINRLVTAIGPELRARWASVGGAFSDAGYGAVHAFPLRWHGHPVGALNLFGRTPTPLDAQRRQLGQAFADLAVAVLVQPTDRDWQRVARTLGDTVAERVTLERAKGVLAVVHEVDLSTASALLVDAAADEGVSLISYARRVLDEVSRPGSS